jgi:hypothetical protein
MIAMLSVPFATYMYQYRQRWLTAVLFDIGKYAWKVYGVETESEAHNTVCLYLEERLKIA